MSKFTKAVIRQAHGRDCIVLWTDAPPPMPGNQLPLFLEFATPVGFGAEYLEKHFPGVPVEAGKPGPEWPKLVSQNRTPTLVVEPPAKKPAARPDPSTCDHKWGIDGQHGNEYCKVCFTSKPSAKEIAEKLTAQFLANGQFVGQTRRVP